MSLAYQAANVKAPFDDASDDNFNVLKFTATTTHAANAVPASWCGKYVSIYVSGGVLHFGFSKNPSAEIDTSVSATAAGASAKVGRAIPDGQERDVRIPSKSEGETIYFVRESSAAADVYMSLSSD